MKKITVLILLLVSVIGLSQPTTLPAIPTRLQANVISIYSDSYTTCATNLNPNWGQSGGVNPTFNPLGTGTNVVMTYTNFNYQGTDLTTQNATNMEYLHVDVWSNASPVTSILKVSPVNTGAGATGPPEVLVTINFTTGVWTSVDIPKSAFTGMTWNAVNQIKFAANGPGSIVPITIYLDNIYFWKSPMPTTAAPTPTSVAANVISLFSNSYPNVGVDTWLTPWSAGNTSTLQIAGNDTRSYTNLNFVGIETTGANTINATCMTHFNIDVWTPNMTLFKIKLVDFGANGVFGGTPNDDVEAELSYTPTLNGWNTYNIPLSLFASSGLITRGHIGQMIFSGNPSGSGIVYIDNVFYSKPSLISLNNGSIFSGQSYTVNVLPGTNSPTYNLMPGNITQTTTAFVLSPTVNTTYTFSSTNLSGCSTTGIFTLTLNPAAPTPTSVAANVISLFSNSYPNVGVDTWLTPWSAGNTSTFQIAGNDTRVYTNLDFVGIETTGANLINANCMTHFNLNLWTPNMTLFRIKLVDWGANGVYQGTPNDDTEAELTFTPTINGWNTYNIPLANFTSAGLINKSNIAQLIFSGTPVGSGIAYIDNVFYSRTAGLSIPSVSISNAAICIGQSFTINPTGSTSFVYSSGSAVVSPTINSTYTITGTNSGTNTIPGCSTKSTINVTVNPNPIITVNNGTICAGQSFTINPNGANTFTIQGANAVVSPSINSTYTVIGTNTITGCRSQAFATSSLTVNPSPIISVNNGTICAGQNFTINPNGANTYTIQGGNAVVSPSSNVNYTVIGTSTAGCLSQAFATSSLSVNANPIITIAGTQTICSGETANITASGANTYTWSNAANTNSISVSPSVTTQYSVAGTNTLGCSNSLTLSIDVQLCTNLNNTNQEFSTINLFPNPNNGQFTINISDEENTQINITNVLGQIILSQKGESITKIDLSKFENGMYFIKVINTNNKTIFNKGIIKQ